MRIIPLVALLFLACGQPTFTEPMTLGGKVVDAHTLNRGEELYVLNCYACHGMEGDGNGPAAPGLHPPPRNFKQGLFKFASTLDPEDDGNTLPTDADLVRLVKLGLNGTPMLPWDLTDNELISIVQYIKTFSPEWKERKPGQPLEVSKDPYGASKRGEAIAAGKRVYYKVAQCWTCHPSYVTKDEFYNLTGKPPENDKRSDFYRAELKDSEYVKIGLDGKERKVRFLPPDFLTQASRSVHELEDVYRAIALGIGGTAMPKWKGALKEEDIWAISYYVYDLIGMRDTKEGDSLKTSLLAQPEWKPPPPPEPEPTPAEEATGAADPPKP